eukprot:1948956-Rhodomonas_salina.6
MPWPGFAPEGERSGKASAIILRAHYAMPGTNMPCCAIPCCAIVPCVRYAIPSMNIPYYRPTISLLSSYEPAMRGPVLTHRIRIVLPDQRGRLALHENKQVGSATCVCRYNAVSSTELACTVLLLSWLPVLTKPPARPCAVLRQGMPLPGSGSTLPAQAPRSQVPSLKAVTVCHPPTPLLRHARY